MPNQYEKLIIPYLEGSLDTKRRAILEELIKRDAHLAQEVESVRRLKYRLQESAAEVTNAHPNNRSAWPAVHARLSTSRRITSSAPQWFTFASACAGAALLIYVVMPKASGPASSLRESQDVASSQLPASVSSSTQGAAAGRFFGAMSAPFEDQTSTNSGIALSSAPQILPLRGTAIKLRDLSQVAFNGPLNGETVHAAIAYGVPFSGRSRSEDYPVQLQSGREYNGYYSSAPAPETPTASPVRAVSSMNGTLDRTSTATNGAAPAQANIGGDVASAPGTTAQSTPSTGSTNDAYQPNFRLAAIAADSETPPSQGTVDSQQSLINDLQSLVAQASTDASSGATSRAVSRWMSVLEATTSSSIYGDDAAEQVATQSLQAAKSFEMLDPMRQQLEQWQSQDAQNIGVCRMLAALYTAQGHNDLALAERLKAAALSSAIGEDWFQAGLAEEQTGNADMANADYEKALQTSGLSNPIHENFARQQIPQMDL